MSNDFEKTGNVQEPLKVLPFKAVIFDMDGTLIQSTEADYRAWEKVFNNYNQELPYHKYVPMLGVKSTDVIKNQIGFTDDKVVKRILKEKYDYFVDYIKANPILPVLASEAFLRSLKEYSIKVALATSSRKEKTRLVLQQLNFLQYFPVVVTGDEVVNSKPAPDIFLLAANRMGVEPKECIVLEDGPIGVAAAKSAKMKCVAITETHPAESLKEADLIIDTYENASLKDIIERLISVSLQ